MMSRRTSTVTLLTAGINFLICQACADKPNSSAHNPSAWGSNHVGQPVPEYEDGNTCLFCHRTSIGSGWQTNRHATTVRSLLDEPNASQLNQKATEAELVLGRLERLRLLKRNDAYGTLSLLESSWSPAEKAWHGNAKWNDSKFGQNCAGCHSSGVDSAAKTFQMPSLDCHTCHGLAVPEHTEDGALMLLSARGSKKPEIEISICASCHLRGGKSKSTGLPYPNNFVPGDNLFKDFEIDMSEKRIAKENPGEAHIMRNIRDVAVLGITNTTCTTCHDVHNESTAKHTKLPKQSACFICHVDDDPLKAVHPYDRHSVTCEY